MAINLTRVYVEVVPNWDRFRRELLAESSRSRDITISPRLDVTAFRAQWRVFAGAFLNRTHRVRVVPTIDRGDLDVMVGQIGEAGNRSSSLFNRIFTTRMKAMIVAVTALIISSLPLLEPLLSMLGSLTVAAGALGAALPLAFAGAALGAATLITVFHGLNKAIKGAFSGTPTALEQEAFDKLSDSAKKFVGILLDARTKLKGFQKEVQEQFFRPFIVGFKELVASPAISILRREMGLLAEVAGRTGADIARVFAASAQSGQLTTILSGIRDIFTRLAVAVAPLTKMFFTLSEAALPFANILTTVILVNLAKLTDLVDKAAADGRLAKFFDDGLTALLQLMRLVINLGSIFKTIFDAITGGSDTALGSLSVLTGKFADFLKTAQGQEILATFASTLKLIGDVIQGVLVPILPLLFEVSQAISGPLKEGIRQVLPALTNFINALVDGLSPILKTLEPVFDELITVVGNFIVLALREMTTHLDKLMPALLEFAEAIGPHLSPLIQAFGDLLLALLPLIPTFTDLLVSLLPMIEDLTPLIIDVIGVMATLTTTFGTVIGWIVQLITWTVNLSQGFTKLGVAMEEVGQFFARIWGHIASWFMGTIVPSLRDALDDIVGFFQFWQRGIDTVLRLFRQGFELVWNAVRDNVFNPMINFITNTVPDAFRRGVELIGTVWNALRALVRAPVEFFINTVVNRGIIGTFRAVAGWIPGLPEVRDIHPPGFAAGGEYSGPVAGRPSSVDNVIARGPHGEPIGLATGEFVVRSSQAQKHKGLLHAINSGLAGYADGGIIDAIMNPLDWVKGKVGDVLDRIPGGGLLVKILKGAGQMMVDGLVRLVKDKLLGGASGFLKGIGGGFGNWPASPGAQRGDSGVWRAIVALIMGTGPISGTFGNAYRPGDPLWHGSGRAVDWMGYNQDALSVFLSLLRPLELIHRTNRRDYAYARGQNRGSFSEGTMEAHRNHVHIAMRQGGLLARIFDGGGIWRPGEIGINTGNRNELVVPEGMKISLSDDTINRIVRGFAMALNGSGVTLLQMGRTRGRHVDV